MGKVRDLQAALANVNPDADVYMYLCYTEDGESWDGKITVDSDPFYYKGDSPVDSGDGPYVVLHSSPYVD